MHITVGNVHSLCKSSLSCGAGSRICHCLSQLGALVWYTQNSITWTCSLCSGEKMVRMAYLGVIASHTVNGVAAIHSSIIRDDLFKDFAEVWPNKFTNVTNGVTQRRWLAFCNEPLSRLITQRLGTDAWIKCVSYKFCHTVLVLPLVQQVVWMVRIKSIRRTQVAPQSLATFCGSAQSHQVPPGSVMHVIQCRPFCWHGH
jgi:hypothetical protein